MNQNEYDELKEQIYRLKQYVDYQDKKMRSFGHGDIARILEIVLWNSKKDDEQKRLQNLQRKICQEINLEMVKNGIVTQESITKTIVNEDGTMGLGPNMFPNLKQKGENDI